MEFEEAKGADPKKETIQTIVAITPQDRTNTLMFTSSVKSFVSTNPYEKEDARKLFGEDAAAMEAIQSLFDQLRPEDRIEYGLAADQAQYRARQLIVRMLQLEDGEISAHDAAADEPLRATVQLAN